MNQTQDLHPEINALAPAVLSLVKQAHSILLHCHPSPDPDSVCSALAMKFVLEKMGKHAVVIQGDSKLPPAFEHFPGAGDIVRQNFFEIDHKEFDLFISLDSSTIDRVSNVQPVVFPDYWQTVNIDHHRTNTRFAQNNLVADTYPATSQILFELFALWGVEMDHDIAANLFVGIYTDTGGLKYRGVSPKTFHIAAALIDLVPDFSDLISQMENSNTPGTIAFQALALSHIETFCNGQLAMSIMTRADLESLNIKDDDIGTSQISPILRSVIGWDIDVVLFEAETNKIKVGLRTRDAERFDVSRLAVALGGGGHKAAAGAILAMSIPAAKELIVEKVKELYNL